MVVAIYRRASVSLFALPDPFCGILPSSPLITLFRDVKIVLIDEATANLDSQADSQMQKCIRDTFADKTVLLITHRLGNIADMDKILRVEDGHVCYYHFGITKNL